MSLSIMPPATLSKNRVDLYVREGVYYARVQHAPSSEEIEIALHGIISEEQARIAVEAMSACSAGEPVC
jgi:hypothetical protein